MPKVYRRRTYRSPLTTRRKRVYRRRRRSSSFPSWLVMLFGFVLLASIVILLEKKSLSGTSSQPPAHSITTQDPAYLITGKPTLSVDFMNQVLAYHHSPAAGKGQVLYDEGLKYGIDPAYALAFFMEESHMGTQGVARTTHSLGNIRATKGYANVSGYRAYSSWDAGIADWYKLLYDLYIHQLGLTTVDQIIPVYAPAGDNNNEGQYIQTVKSLVDLWRSGYVDFPK
ncbi:glucosaminidase domain-containing protein [Tengunoibacter tsumagoiensis]|uniref:Mannosyl-glycoprotein endo-beta-N-acetylglucosamidase-like domain-containing protein n=1 Tax=Tengunoibacter tsumagoiensis TaxID=2014871 RepID=A0A401ZXV1_9CHLR|nr:glucosaminidase domain-containing protein [Tengunoibacter tsumagoiensis]GCE11669.1 hypothetical protein KTT_15280 [Tengunoibacter tsumagoiensis]